MTYTEIINKYLDKNANPEKSTNLILLKTGKDTITDVCLNLFRKHALQLKTIKATDEGC